MKAFQDSKTKLWNWGKGNVHVFKTKEEAEQYGLKELVKALKKVRESLGN